MNLKELVISNKFASVFGTCDIEINLNRDDIDKYFKINRETKTNIEKEMNLKYQNSQSENEIEISSLIENNKYTIICIIYPIIIK